MTKAADTDYASRVAGCHEHSVSEEENFNVAAAPSINGSAGAGDGCDAVYVSRQTRSKDSGSDGSTAPAVPAVPVARNAALVSEEGGLLKAPLERFLGQRSARQLAKLGLHTVYDLLMHVPFRLAKRGELMPIEAVNEGDVVTVVARVLRANLRPMNARRGFILTVTVTDGIHDLDMTFFAKNSRPLKFHEMQLRSGVIAAFSGIVSSYRGSLQLAHPDYQLLDERDTASTLSSTASESSSGELCIKTAKVCHAGGETVTAEKAADLARPIPIYHASASAPSWKIEQAVKIIFPRLSERDIPDPLPDELLHRRHLASKLEALKELHIPSSEDSWKQAKKRMAYEEAFLLQSVLARSRARALEHAARASAPRTDGVAGAFDAQLPFELTAGQRSVGEDIAGDLSRSVPMRRLLQGDVGAGKTIVALRAMLQIIDAGGQAVLLAPTEVLARQHYETFQAMLGDLGMGGQLGAPAESIRLELVTGSLSTAQRRAVLARIASGESQLIVGTHALLEDNVQIPFLGLVVVDEQHRFGVNQRDKLAQGVHLLVMTATPIPRTIAMSSFGDLDVSILGELPRGRAPIQTVLVPERNSVWVSRVWERAREEVERGGRVYVVCPRINASDSGNSGDSAGGSFAGLGKAHGAEEGDGGDGNLQKMQESSGGCAEMASVETVYEQLRCESALQGVQCACVHGRLTPEEKSQAMNSFVSGETPILIATTVIEVGIDVPQATMMVILNAERFGLSQLHQLRGRIGRGQSSSICLAIHSAADGTIAYERLCAFAGTTNGFELAEKDLELRAEGDVLGAQQSGTHSSLHFLSVLHDGQIIDEAKTLAGEIMRSDPHLERPEHQALAAAVTAVEATAEADYIERM